MAAVTGPISSRPGSAHDLPAGTKCDSHPDRQAVARIQGETDSFGCEMNDCCQECVDEIRAYARSAEARSGQCDWCKNEATDLRDRRDYDEGMAGPVYRVCGACVKRQNERLAEEAREYEDDGDFEWDDDRDLTWDEDDYHLPVMTPPKAGPVVMCKRCRAEWSEQHRCGRRRA